VCARTCLQASVRVDGQEGAGNAQASNADCELQYVDMWMFALVHVYVFVCVRF